MRDKHQRDVIAIGLRLLGDARAKEIEAAPVDNREKIELLGQVHLPRFLETSPYPRSTRTGLPALQMKQIQAANRLIQPNTG